MLLDWERAARTTNKLHGDRFFSTRSCICFSLPSFSFSFKQMTGFDRESPCSFFVKICCSKLESKMKQREKFVDPLSLETNENNSFVDLRRSKIKENKHFHRINSTSIEIELRERRKCFHREFSAEPKNSERFDSRTISFFLDDFIRIFDTK